MKDQGKYKLNEKSALNALWIMFHGLTGFAASPYLTQVWEKAYYIVSSKKPWMLDFDVSNSELFLTTLSGGELDIC